jgi:hypothetical protein
MSTVHALKVLAPSSLSLTNHACVVRCVHSQTMTAKKWGKEDDAKLAELFRLGPRNGGVTTKDLSAKAVKKVNDTHFPERAYKNFVPLFRKKARAYNLNQTLNGARRKFHSVSLAMVLVHSLQSLLSLCLLLMIRSCRRRGSRGGRRG